MSRDMYFFQNSCRKLGTKTCSRPLCFLKKRKHVISLLVLLYLGCPWLEHTIKTNFRISDCWSRDMLNFNYLGKGLGLVYDIFGNDFSRKIIIMVYFINWPFTSWYIGQYVYCNFFVPQLMTSEILKSSLPFLLNRFPIWPKKSWQKFEYFK